MPRFKQAIVRPPAANFAAGLTTAGAGVPDFALALRQHRRSCEALSDCGLQVTSLPADSNYPDGTFVEDAAIVTPRGAILTRPGAPSRRGEVESVGAALGAFYADLARIASPGLLDGGDICEADGHFFIGRSARTDAEGAAQLAIWLATQGYTSSIVDIREHPALLHLKSGIAYLGDGVLVAGSTLPAGAAFDPLRRFEVIAVPPTESYAANCIRVNDAVLIAAGYPRTAAALRERGFALIELDMSEFKKMDGGLSCLSLRF
jgi:dimethylargininase